MKVHENWIALKATIQPEKEKTVPSEHKLEQKIKIKKHVFELHMDTCATLNMIYTTLNLNVLLYYFLKKEYRCVIVVWD